MGHGGLTALDDTTPLNGPSIDPAVRIGWVVRTARLLRQEPGSRRLEDLARRTGSNVTRLHRLETGQLRDGLLVDAYEQALDLPGGSLRAPIDILCRTFPATSPRDRSPGAPIDCVHDLSRLTELLLDERQQPSGGQWLDWARAVSHSGAIGLPDFLAGPLVHRLVSELGRSVSHGYPTRYEALSLLRCSAYADVVLDVAREVVDDPHVQRLLDLMSAVGESVTPDAVAWCLDLLEDPRDRVVTGGALALENMGQVSDDAARFWDPLVPRLVCRLAEAEEGGHRWEWLSHLLRLVPQPVREGHDVRSALPLAPLADITDWSRTRRNRHWMACRARGAEITRRLGLPDEPVLARLLFDIAVSPLESRAVTSYMLVGAVPEVAALVGDRLADFAEETRDEVLAARAVRRLPGTLHGTFPAAAERWLDGDDAVLRDCAVRMAGAAGREIPEPVLEEALRTSHCPATYAAGMTGHPVLARWAGDPDPEVSGAATWWLRHGTRVIG